MITPWTQEEREKIIQNIHLTWSYKILCEELRLVNGYIKWGNWGNYSGIGEVEEAKERRSILREAKKTFPKSIDLTIYDRI